MKDLAQAQAQGRADELAREARQRETLRAILLALIEASTLASDVKAQFVADIGKMN